MNVFRNIFILLITIVPFKFAFSQDYQIGLHFGHTKLKNVDRYLETIIDGPFDISDDDFFESGYIFDRTSFISKSNVNIGLMIEYKLSDLIHPFMNLTYFKITSTGESHVFPLLSGGLMDMDTRFKIESSFYVVQLGTNIIFKTRNLMPFLSFSFLYNRIKNNDVELLNVNEDFIKCSHKYTFGSISNIGLGLGFGIKIPLTKKIYLSTKAEYDNLNLIYSEVNKSLVNHSFSVGILFQL